MARVLEREGVGEAYGAAASSCLEARDRLARSLKRAFPLPDSGSFADLLGALAASGEGEAE